VPPDRRDPKVTTTHGVGELLVSAATHPGVRHIVVGLGGSATNDGGAGLLSALGVRFLDARGRELPPGGAALADLASLDGGNLRVDPGAVDLLIACDVDNPLTGPRGASAVFGPQKGATSDDVEVLDAALGNFARVAGRVPVPGSGAAGGTAFGLLYLFPKAALRPGIELVLDAVGFDGHLPGAALVLTGEGLLDAQTLSGKTVAGVAARAKRAGVPVGAVVGAIGPDADLAALAEKVGVDAVMPLPPGPCDLEEAMANAEAWVDAAAERAARWMRLGGRAGAGLRAQRAS
jgi:glycerate kinase